MCKCCQLPVAKNQLGTGKWNWLLATLATFLPLLALSTPPAMTEFPRFPVIVPSMENHAGDIAADLRRLTSETVVDAAALNASLQPRGDPPDDRAAGYVRFFRQLREAAGPDGPPLGVLLQSTMGHGGMPTNPAPFQRIVTSWGDSRYIFCPLDDAFLAYLKTQVAALAAERPAFFILDDDTRLRTHRDACYCPLHLAEFSRRTGREWRDREALHAALEGDSALAAAWEKLRLDTIARLARVVREAFDAVNPAIPGAFCCCEGDVGDALPLARILAAPGQRPVVRLNNGRYLHDGNRDLPAHLLRTEGQRLALPPDADALLLDEPDTYPHNRYSVSAANFHLHVSLGLLSGCGGAKLWLSRTRAWEPASGTAYRKVLAKNKGFYEELLKLWGAGNSSTFQPFNLSTSQPFNFSTAEGIVWDGLRIPLTAPAIGAGSATPPEGLDWGASLLGRMGIPYAYVRPEEVDGPTPAALAALFPEPLPKPGDSSFGAFKSWFNETRKREVAEALARLARDARDLPCWYAGDAEVLLRAGRSADGWRVLLIVPLSHDVLDEIPLRFPFGAPAEMERLLPDGSWRPASFDPATGVLSETVLPAEPAVFRYTP